MWFKIDENTIIYAKDYSIGGLAPNDTKRRQITIKDGYIYVDTSWGSKESAKAEREKVWEMARKIVLAPDFGGISYEELEDCFGAKSATAALRIPVDEALEKYEVWKKTNSAEEIIKSLKPQDVIAIPSYINNSVKSVMMITLIEHPSGLSYRIQGINSDGCTADIVRKITDYKGLKKIGRVVETTDILGEIKKIEDEWRYSCGS